MMCTTSPDSYPPPTPRRSERRLSTDDVGLRRSLFGLCAEDEANLDRIRFAVREDLPGLVASFYDDPLALSGTTSLVHGEVTLESLRGAQRNYLTTLGLDSDTEEYVEGRTRIAQLHEAAGLDRTWYMGAHARLFRSIGRLLARHYADADRLMTLLVTLQRILAFDSYLVVEAYLRADDHRVERTLQDLTESQRRILAVSRRDDLTQVDSRAFLLETLEEEIDRSRRAGDEFSLLFIDVDNFKAVNDTYGHATGDEVLRGIVDVIKRSLRPGDIVGRYGGDEFIVGLLQTGQTKAAWIADRVCRRVTSYAGTGTAVTVSIGCASLTPGDDVGHLIHRADGAMYAAKAAGRNRVSIQMRAVPGARPSEKSTSHADSRHLTLLGNPVMTSQD